jgi:hypothetical protein
LRIEPDFRHACDELWGAKDHPTECWVPPAAVRSVLRSQLPPPPQQQQQQQQQQQEQLLFVASGADAAADLVDLCLPPADDDGAKDGARDGAAGGGAAGGGAAGGGAAADAAADSPRRFRCFTKRDVWRDAFAPPRAGGDGQDPDPDTSIYDDPPGPMDPMDPTEPDSTGSLEGPLAGASSERRRGGLLTIFRTRESLAFLDFCLARR